jgi:hypothetical protein
MASIFEAMYCAPAAAVQLGCSHWADGATSHDTCGSRSLSASSSNQPAGFLTIALCHSTESWSAVAYCLHHSSALSS